MKDRSSKINTGWQRAFVNSANETYGLAQDLL